MYHWSTKQSWTLDERCCWAWCSLGDWVSSLIHHGERSPPILALKPRDSYAWHSCEIIWTLRLVFFLLFYRLLFRLPWQLQQMRLWLSVFSSWELDILLLLYLQCCVGAPWLLNSLWWAPRFVILKLKYFPPLGCWSFSLVQLLWQENSCKRWKLVGWKTWAASTSC